MTPEANKTIVRRYIDELNHRNIAILDELVDDQFRPVVRQGYHRNVTAFPDTFVEILDMIAEGEQVAVEGTHRGVLRGLYDGIPATGKTITGNVFLRDLKLLDAVTVDVPGNRVAVALDKLYPGIDLAETLSCLTGKWIKRITRDTVEFDDGSTSSLSAPRWEDIKPLVWW